MIRVNPYSFSTKSYSKKNVAVPSVYSSRVSAPEVSFFGAQRLLPNGNYPKKLIKLISLDIDGTISDRLSNKVSDELKEAVKSVMSRGIKVILNTGRHYEDALKVAKELDLDSPIICNYGQYIKQNGRLIYENPIYKVDLKGDTLEYLANQMGIKKENIMSIGNDYEDASMFKKSGTAVFIENNYSSFFDGDEARPFANYITDNENYSGVALAIKKLVK